MRLAVLVLIAFACAACNGDGSFDSPNTPDTTGTVGAAGGTVEVTSGRLAGTKVVIPAGALADHFGFAAVGWASLAAVALATGILLGARTPGETSSPSEEQPVT